VYCAVATGATVAGATSQLIASSRFRRRYLSTINIGGWLSLSSDKMIFFPDNDGSNHSNKKRRREGRADPSSNRGGQKQLVVASLCCLVAQLAVAASTAHAFSGTALPHLQRRILHTATSLPTPLLISGHHQRRRSSPFPTSSSIELAVSPSNYRRRCYRPSYPPFSSVSGTVGAELSSTGGSLAAQATAAAANDSGDEEDEVPCTEVLVPADPEVTALRKGDTIPKAASASTDHSLSLSDTASLVAFLAAFVVAFYALIHASGPGAWRYYLAGGICAAVSHTIPVPIDVVKTRKQVDPTLQDKNFLDATRYIVKEEGINTLLAGLGPTTVGYLLEGALKFGVYEVLKPVVSRLLVGLARVAPSFAFCNTQMVAFVTCAACSGVAASIVLSPLEALRIRLVAEPDFAPGGWIQGGYKMVRTEGMYGLIKGIKPMLYKQVPYTIVKNVSFDYMARHAYSVLRRNGVVATAAIKFTVPLFAAAVASVLSCVSSQPGDMLLSLINAHGGDRRTRDIVKDILRSDRGVRGFFMGMKTRLLHVGLIVTLQLLLYDFIKRLCGIAATGLAH